jgi:hypothetical protein
VENSGVFLPAYLALSARLQRMIDPDKERKDSRKGAPQKKGKIAQAPA